MSRTSTSLGRLHLSTVPQRTSGRLGEEQSCSNCSHMIKMYILLRLGGIRRDGELDAPPSWAGVELLDGALVSTSAVRDRSKRIEWKEASPLPMRRVVLPDGCVQGRSEGDRRRQADVKSRVTAAFLPDRVPPVGLVPVGRGRSTWETPEPMHSHGNRADRLARHELARVEASARALPITADEATTDASSRMTAGCGFRFKPDTHSEMKPDGIPI